METNIRKEKRFSRVGVLMGGPSSEREVSLRSGAAVAKGLRAYGYDVDEIVVNGRDVDVPSGVEAVFIALHGEFGEDGKVQKILRSRGIAYTGSGPEASRDSFDKEITKRILVQNGISTPNHEVVSRSEERSLNFPLVVKPTCQGSSIGVHRVRSIEEWDNAARDVISYGGRMLLEEFINGRELTVGVVGEEVLPVVEIRAPGSWYDYEAKYTSGKTEYLVPAPLENDCSDKCKDLAIKTFRALGCRGLGRIDMLLAQDGGVYVLELNSIPGFTETSLLPKAAAIAGMDFPVLCGRIMEMAEL